MLLQHWIASQPGVVDGVETLVCDGKTLRGSIDESTSGAARFIAQVSLYANSLGPLPKAPMPPMPEVRSRLCAPSLCHATAKTGPALLAMAQG